MLEVEEHYMKSRLDTFMIFSAVKHFFKRNCTQFSHKEKTETSELF